MDNRLTPDACKCRNARSNSWLRTVRFWAMEATNPLISYSAPPLPLLLSVTQGAGVASKERQPIIARSSASITVCGRA
ncbi:hypothetical protein D3C80_2056360 [compost metagenome]